MRVQALLVRAILFALLIPLPSCKRAVEMNEQAIKREFMSQIRSLSSSGPMQASLIMEWSRDLRLTTDGGRSWQTIPSHATGDAFESATFIDNKRGWAVNHQGQVFSTDSAGASWTKLSELKDFTGANQMVFLNENDGWIREFLSLWRTTDGGQTWREVLSTLTPGVHGQPTSIFAIDANTLVSSGSGGQVYLTRDGGETWKIETPLTGDLDFNDVWFVDQKHGWLTGYIGGQGFRPLLFETTDGGESWKEMPLANSDIRPSSICFVGEEGWLSSDRRHDNGQRVWLEGVLLHTKDGGKHWNPVQLGSAEPLFGDIRFNDREHGWLVGRDSVYSTQDGGETWQRVLSLPPVQ